MFPTPQSALPLPVRPSLERYRKMAKELVRLCKSGGDLRGWAEAWVGALVRLAEVELAPRMPVRVREWVDGVEAFARQTLSGDAKGCTLANAQFVLARCHGFESWPKFARHLEALASRDSAASRFEAAADAVVAGDGALLRRLLSEDPGLARARSTREHGATLLHYVAANGVEGYRQRTPGNIVEMAGILLDAGAEVDATANVYGGGATALGLAATSGHPERAGVQMALLETLLRHGAVEGMMGPSLVMACLANGRGKAAEFLAGRRGTLTFVEAAALGRLELVRGAFSGESRLDVDSEPVQEGFLYACQFGRDGVVEFLLEMGVDPAVTDRQGQTGLHWAAIGAFPGTVKLLLAHGAGLEGVNAYGGTVMGQALWSAGHDSDHDGDADRYLGVLEVLHAAGARLPEGHAPVSARIDEWLEARGSRTERDWSW